jgi:lipopolysaccharide export system protein LptC
MGTEGRPTVARARLVTTNADNSEFILQGDAVVVRESGVGASGEVLPRLEFRGEYLKVFMDPERVISDQPVTLLRGADRLVADSLDYRSADRVADFKGRVRVQLVPR